jgi:hypothetical protein
MDAPGPSRGECPGQERDGVGRPEKLFFDRRNAGRLQISIASHYVPALYEGIIPRARFS